MRRDPEGWGCGFRLNADIQPRGPNVGTHRKLLLARLLRKRPIYLEALNIDALYFLGVPLIVRTVIGTPTFQKQADAIWTTLER